MGTRSLTAVKQGGLHDSEILLMYRQFDGYLSGHGKDLVDFLKPFRVVNGLGGGEALGNVANGMGCLAAQVVREWKDEVGGIYLYPPDARDCGQDYTYTVYLEEFEDLGRRSDRLAGRLRIETIPRHAPKLLYDGYVDECNIDAVEASREFA